MTIKNTLTSGVAAVSAAGLVAAGTALTQVPNSDAVVPMASVTSDYKLTAIQDIDPARALEIFLNGFLGGDGHSGQIVDDGDSATKMPHEDETPHWATLAGYWDADGDTDEIEDPEIVGPVGVAYYLIDNVLPSSFLVDDYFFGTNSSGPATIASVFYQLGEATGSDELITLGILTLALIQDPIGLINQDLSDFLHDPVGGILGGDAKLALKDPVGAVFGKDVSGALKDPAGAVFGKDVSGALKDPIGSVFGEEVSGFVKSPVGSTADLVRSAGDATASPALIAEKPESKQGLKGLLGDPGKELKAQFSKNPIASSFERAKNSKGNKPLVDGLKAVQKFAESAIGKKPTEDNKGKTDDTNKPADSSRAGGRGDARPASSKPKMVAFLGRPPFFVPGIG